ncbi:MAG: hypothetical protein CVU99_04370 [Firmicutes bacterium HGW-Firmicutes-4]|jgi:hypothetical protein|nr:MAG: hypothetical protein CVU99_04370 [Firmicutes bacterium HGW-Firmicutes-4]
MNYKKGLLRRIIFYQGVPVFTISIINLILLVRIFRASGETMDLAFSGTLIIFGIFTALASIIYSVTTKQSYQNILKIDHLLNKIIKQVNGNITKSEICNNPTFDLVQRLDKLASQIEASEEMLGLLEAGDFSFESQSENEWQFECLC